MKPGIAVALNNLGLVAQYQGDYTRAVALHQDCLALRREMQDTVGIALALGNLGLLARDEGDAERAAALHHESLAFRRELGDRVGEALALNNLGLVAGDQGDYERADAFFGDSLALRRELGDRNGMATTFSDWADTARYQGNYERAVDLYRESIELCQTLGYENVKSVVSSYLDGMAAIAAAQGQSGRSARLWGAAEALRSASGMPLAPVDRVRYQRDVAAACISSGREAFDEEWAAGRALPQEDAIADAIALSRQLSQ